MRFLLDAHLLPALKTCLESRDCEAVHVRDVGLTSVTDRTIWDVAVNTAAIIITKDADFLQRKAALGRRAPVVIHLRAGTCSTLELLILWANAWPGITERLSRGEHMLTLERPIP